MQRRFPAASHSKPWRIRILSAVQLLVCEVSEQHVECSTVLIAPHLAAMQTKLVVSQPVAAPRTSLRRLPARRQACKPVAAMPNTQLVICAATAGCLALGRFVFLPFTRDQQERAGQQMQGGEGGDTRIQVR